MPFAPDRAADAAERPVKRIALSLCAAAFFCGCETSSTVTQSPNPVKCQVTVATPPMMEAGAGPGSLAITTQPECAWDVSTNVSWISALSPASGQGAASVSFRVAANDGASMRDGTIVVNGEQVRVSQRAPCRYDVGPSSQNVGSSGSAGSINITTTNDCGWTAASDSGWIVLASSPTGSGNGTVSFTVAPNQGDTRSGAIAVANQRSTITQAGVSAPAPNCSATISPTSQNMAAAGGAGTPVTVSSPVTCRWTATSGATWITINSGATGSGNGTVTFSVTANSGAARTGTLTIAGRAFTVSQAASGSPAPPAACSYSISPTQQQRARARWHRHCERIHYQRVRVDRGEQCRLDHHHRGCDRDWQRERRVSRCAEHCWIAKRHPDDCR